MSIKKRALASLDHFQRDAKLKKAHARHDDVLTFRLSHSPCQIQLLSSHSIYSLVDTICRETCVGLNENVYDHLWNVRVNSRKYEYHPHGKECETKLSELELKLESSIILTYDYGTTSLFGITLVSKEVLPGDGRTSTATFPRRKPEAGPIGYTEFSPATEVRVNDLFPTFNTWAFGSHASGVALNFFQAGRKHHYGFVERGSEGVRHMIYLPVKAGPDLSDYFHVFNFASQFKYLTDPHPYPHPHYCWMSMVVFPHDDTSNKMQKYSREQEVGFCEARRAPSPNITKLNSIFPKLAALAGYKKDPDKKVKKGWITYQNKVLRICSGKAMVCQSNAPKTDAFAGGGQHKPAGASEIMCQMNIEIQSFQHLFCVTEGMLRTI